MVASTDNYTLDRAQRYDAHHQSSLRNKLTNWREQRVLERALRDAGRPASALDMPCGTGRFWPAFYRAGVRQLVAADGSEGMLKVAAENHLNEGFPIQLIHTSAFAIELPDNAVAFAACLRFYHHLSLPEDRAQLLAELRRVSSRYVALSLWVDGNLAGNRRMRRAAPTPVAGYGRRICRRREDVEAEFTAAGFVVRGRYDVWPYLYMWRLYLLDSGD